MRAILLNISIIIIFISLNSVTARTNELTLGFPLVENPECFLPRKETPDDGLLSPENIACPGHPDGLHECCRCIWTLHFRHMWFKRDYEYNAYLQKLQTIAIKKKKKKLQYGIPRKYIPREPPSVNPKTFIAPMVPWQVLTSQLGASAWTIVDFRCRVTLPIDDWELWFPATSHYFKSAPPEGPVRLPYITRNYRLYCRPDEYFQETASVYEESNTTGDMKDIVNTLSGRCAPKDSKKARETGRNDSRRPYKLSRVSGLQRLQRFVESHTSQCIEISRDRQQGHMNGPQETVVSNQDNVLAQQSSRGNVDVDITLWPELHIPTGDLFTIDRDVDGSKFNLDNITGRQQHGSLAAMSAKLIVTRKQQDRPPMSSSHVLYQGGPFDLQTTSTDSVSSSHPDFTTSQWKAIPDIADARYQACIVPEAMTFDHLPDLELRTEIRVEHNSNDFGEL